MAEAEQTPDSPTLVSNEDPHPDPFSGNSVRITVTKRLDLGLLQSELVARTKAQVMLSLSVDDPEHIASDQRPAVLFVSPGNISKKVIQDIVAAHVPAPAPAEAGAPPAPTNTINPATLPDEYQPLIEKLAAGETLKTAESSDLLRALLGIESKD